MKTIIFLAVHESGSSREAVRAAERLGFYIVVLTDQPWQRERRNEYPDIHQMILCNLRNIGELRDHIRNLLQKGLEISSIISFIDPHCYTASLLAEEFGVGCFSSQAIINMQDKILSRKIMEPLFFFPTGDHLSATIYYYRIFNADKPAVTVLPKVKGSGGSYS